jgi:hypothetical protein
MTMTTTKTAAALWALFLPALLGLVPAGGHVSAQSLRDEGGGSVSPAVRNVDETVLPLRRLALFSSGVGFFEHSGTITSSPALITLPFSTEAVNDALKSLAVNDPASDFPTVRYASSSALWQTLRSLKIDLSGNPGIGDILNSLKGAELEISAPSPLSGRIIGVESRPRALSFGGEGAEELRLSLFTSQGIRSVPIGDIVSFSFGDEKINADLNRALDLIMNSRDERNRSLLLTLPGAGVRDVSLSYVIPVPVWKVSYRLDLSSGRPFIQGWAIVDNDSDTDWEGVELSLVTGRPVSFIQNLYDPYRTSRPVLPLAIAGIAEARSYESGSGGGAAVADAATEEMEAAAYDGAYGLNSVARQSAAAKAAPMMEAPAPAASPGAAGTIQSASGRSAGDQFEFTLKRPVSVERRQSAMLPLVQAGIKAERTLVLAGAGLVPGVTVNPAISAELVNTTGMKLPAGPVTVYDGGSYTGDALIEFFPENEKRIISYGDDLSVTASAAAASVRTVTGVTVSGGIMTILRKQTFSKTYTLRNAAADAKKLIVEHPVTSGADLALPASYTERTPGLYRFAMELPARDTVEFTVREEMPLSERVVLAQLRPEAFLSYSVNEEIPAAARAALTRAMELKGKAGEAEAAAEGLESQITRLVSEQERVRQNLLAAGNQTPQGQEYLRRMANLDGEIDALNLKRQEAEDKAAAAKKEYESYIASLTL